ncbi:MAG: VWA domain-containing protein [Candidatus Acidoferrales bacterium]
MKGNRSTATPRPVWRLAIPAGLLLVGSAWLAAQQPPLPQPSATVLRVTTRLVLVDVVVRDKDGNPVRDLTKEDFVLLEEGEPQEIATFSFEQPGQQVPPPPPLPPHVFTNRPQYTVPPGPLTILLLDALNTRFTDQAYVRDQMMRYLTEQLEPNQRTAIFALGRRLHLLQNFTTDPELLRAALAQFAGEQSVELRRGEGIEISPQIAAAMALVPNMLESLQQFDAERTYQSVDRRVATTLKALRMIARSTAGYPGRKNLIWVSSAFPFTLNPTNFALYRNYAEQMRQTASLLTDARVAVYPVDARGLVGSSGFSATTSGPFGGPALAGQLGRESELLASSHHSMRQLAKDTGGRAFVNRNDIDIAVQLGVADGSNYYSLGYYPTNKDWDGKFRRIEVRLLRKGVEVRHRRGYYASNPADAWQELETNQEEEERKTGDLQDALFSPMPPTVITFLVEVPPPQPARPATVEVRLLVDAHTLTFEEDGGRQRCHLDFLVGAFSPQGELVNQISQTLNASLRPQTYQRIQQRGLPFQTQLELDPGRYTLRVLVRDNRTGLLGVTDIPLVIQEP